MTFLKAPSWILSLLLIFPFGCGYTSQAVLPRNIQTIYVETVKNEIPLEEVYAYQPGLEIQMTDAVIRRLQTDGNLRVVSKENADAIVDMSLIRFEQEGLRFTSLERVEEYRLFIVVELILKDAKTGEVIWSEPNFSGDAEYFVSDVKSIAREEATSRAIDRFAKNVVDRIVEDW